MNVGNTAIHGLQTAQLFVNFNKSDDLKLLLPKKGKAEYIRLRTEMSFLKKRNVISTFLSFKFIVFLLI
jgi:hypothetical protein